MSAESGPSSCNTGCSWLSEVGVPVFSWEGSSEQQLMVGDITSGLVSHDSVLCSDVAVVVMVVTMLGGMGSKSSSSSSRLEHSLMSVTKEDTIIYIIPSHSKVSHDHSSMPIGCFNYFYWYQFLWKLGYIFSQVFDSKEQLLFVTLLLSLLSLFNASLNKY